MKKTEQILQSLIMMCKDNEIIPMDFVINKDDDMFEYGVIDSMGLTILTFAIEENYGLQIAPELLIAELRTPRAIAEYIAENSGVNSAAIPA